MTKQDYIVKFASEKLGSIPRASTGSAFDHGYRVAEYIRTRLEIDDQRVYAIALLHDIFEDTDVDKEMLIYVLGQEVVNGIEQLTRRGKRPQGDDQILAAKIEQNLCLMDDPYTVRLIKCADRIDNLTDALDIPPKSTKYKRVPYWAVETKLSMYALARMTHKVVYDDMVKLTSQIVEIYPDEVRDIEINYLASGNRKKIDLDTDQVFRD